MKIIIDNLDSPPPHALSRQDIKAVLAVLPKESDFSLPIVHLKATLPANYDRDYAVDYDFLGGPKLNVRTRGMSPQEALRRVLRELAIQGLRKSTRWGHRLSHVEMEEVDRRIAPLLVQFDKARSEQTEPARDTNRYRIAYRALEAAGFTWMEAYQVVKAIEDEGRSPTSRSKANQIHRAKQALRDAGVDPETMTISFEE
jgi:hypothetical protein